MSVRFFARFMAVGFIVVYLGQPAVAQPGRPGANRFLERIKAFDKNKDGKITKQEAGGPLAQRFNRIDTNRDGVIDQAELKKLAERFGGGRPPVGGGVAEEGKPAPDFNLKSLDGRQTVKLSNFAGKKPVALVFGSYT